MHTRCPQCQHELAADDAANDVGCPSCGSVLNVIGKEESTTAPGAPEETIALARKSSAVSSIALAGELGDYELLDEVARGGMGVVYKARQRSLNRIVALKLILSGQLASTHDVARFFAEAESAASLDHPGIVPVHEFGEHEGQHYFSMGFVEGESLADKIKDGPLPPPVAAEYTRKIAEAVAFAHERGVIHRDLKPGNVLIDQADSPKVTDFGLAKKVKGDSGLTSTGQILGTPSYMPPEQAGGKTDHVDERSDVYSLGAILYALLTGRPPFAAASPLDTLVQVLEQEPVAPRQLNQKVSRDLETICLKCLQKDASRRYPTATELSEDLRRALNHEPIKARPVSTAEKAWRWCRRRPAVSGLMATVLVLIVVGVAAIMAERRSSQRRAVRNSVSSMQTARGNAVSFAIDTLKHLPESLVVDELRSQFESTSGVAKLSLAYALAEYGQCDTEFLVSSIVDASNDECSNIVTALEHDKTNALNKLSELTKDADTNSDWTFKGRLSVIALHLGDRSIAADVHKNRPDPTQQTVFIHDVFPTWHADLKQLAETVETTNDTSLRSGMCLAMGNLQEDIEEAEGALRRLLTRWYVEAPDSGTHSAADWALRQWKLELPVLPPDTAEPTNRNWKVTPHGFTMVRIRAGQFERTDATSESDAKQTVTLTHDLWLSNVEVSAGLFLQFVEDDSYRGAKPNSWDGVDTKISPTPSHPAQMVSWEDAVMFCNWLSETDGWEQCYLVEPIEDATADITLKVTLVSGRNGYRLPTEAEWEYACRAGTTTHFGFGKERGQLTNYAVFLVDRAQPLASKMPNRWGLFDIHGSVWEWCHDWHGAYSVETVEDPQGPGDGTYRIHRGGGWGHDAWICRSENRSGSTPAGRGSMIGFRIAQVALTSANE